MLEFAAMLFVNLVVLALATLPLWAGVWPQMRREKEYLERLRAEEENRRRAAIVDMGRQMAALGLRPSDYTKEQLRQMQGRA